MREIVIVSSWRRADYLRTCLDALMNARGSQDRDIWVFQNNRADAAIDLMPVLKVLADYVRRPNVTVIPIVKSSWMEAHKYAWERVYAANPTRAYFFSDDVVATPDFFEWHDAVQAQGPWWGSTAWRPPTGQIKPFDPSAYYVISWPNEISMGLCVGREAIKELKDGWPSQEQMEGRRVVMPYVQRCFHVGGFSSNENSVGENTGPAVDVLPNPIPDYGRQNVVLKP